MDKEELDLETLLPEVQRAVSYSYMAGDYPTDMSPDVQYWVDGDGGLLRTLEVAIELIAKIKELTAEIEGIRAGLKLQGHMEGMPCHHLYSRCFRTDAELLEYRVRQREHGDKLAREQIIKQFREMKYIHGQLASDEETWNFMAAHAIKVIQGKY